jgi:5S rRNA maturation endonuclease (ribonuclease M5)
MYISEFLPLLNGAKKSGEGWIARCPAHDDKTPSLSVSNGAGKILLKCHAGCSLNSILAALGLNAQELFSGNGSGGKESRPIIAEHDYYDAQGRFLFQKARFATKPKTKPRHKGPDGQWIWGAGTDRRPLYRLPEILKAVEVVVVEGEKDADNLWKLGFPATTTAFGNWLPENLQALSRKEIFVIGDNDTTGSEKVLKAIEALKGSAKSVKVVQLPTEGKPQGYDVSNFIEEFDEPEAAAEKLCILMENAKELPKPPTLGDAIMTAQRFTSLSLPEKVSILHPWLTTDGIILVSGWRNVGKTWFVIGILDAVTTGNNFGPWETKKPVPCLYLDGEMPAQDIQERLGKKQPDRKAPLYIYSDAYANQLGLKKANMLDPEWRNSILGILLNLGVKLFVVDNIASLSPGIDENSKSEWDPINQWLLELRFKGITTLLLHHLGKEGSQRGTSSREDNIDTSIMLKSPPGYNPEDGARFICSFGKNRIRHKHLHMISDSTFHMIPDENGNPVWSYKSTNKANKIEVLKMFDEEFTNKDIAEQLGITPGRVSQLKKEGVKDGYLSKNSKLTQRGFNYVHIKV